MLVEVVADGLWAYRLGRASAALIFPLAGALVLVVGIYRRRAYNRWNTLDDDRLLHTEGPRDDEPDADADVPTPPSGRGTVFIVVGVVLLILGGLHVMSYLAASHTSTADGYVEVGQCITTEAYEQGRINAEPVDCGRSDATYQLASTGDGAATCPDGLRDSSLYPALINDVRTQCFIPNLRAGHCYVAPTATAVDCTDPTANVKVASRIEGATDGATCGTDATVKAFPEPPRVYCLVAP